MEKTILIIEDNQQDQKIITRILKNAGIDQVIIADNAEAGLENARKHKPDLIILDLMLPQMDGHQFCDALKKDTEHKNIPILMLTGREDFHNMKKGFDTGVDAYVVKSFKKKETLIGIIRGLLGE